MSSRFLLALFALALALPGATAQAAAEGPDFVLTFHADGTATYEGPAELLVPVESEAGERYAWQLLLTDDYTVGELRDEGAFDVERVRQIVPMIHIDPSMPVCQDDETNGACEYPLFEWVPRTDMRDVDAPVRITNGSGAPGAWIVRVGLPGPAAMGQDVPLKAQLVVARDVTPPVPTLGEVENLSEHRFDRQTRTDELALGDLQVRKNGSDEWVRNPTTIYHFIQKFPVQGFDAETRYDMRMLFTDWAGNVHETTQESFTTPAKPEVPEPRVTPLFPAPNATLGVGQFVNVQALIESPESPVELEGVRLYYDLSEVHEGFSVENGVLTYAPKLVEPGLHVVSVEVTNVAGGTAHARWTFTVGEVDTAAAAGDGATQSTPGFAAGAALLALGTLALVARRR